jgi:AraC-like DNA-binding protein
MSVLLKRCYYFRNMDTTGACVLSGRLRDYSTKRLHKHRVHQFLSIAKGVSLLETERGRQPLYGEMCAFLPAGLPHRSIVVGKDMEYRSIYLKPDRFSGPSNIAVFRMSALAQALYARIANQGSVVDGIGRRCVSLFLEVVREDMKNLAFGLCLPRPKRGENRAIAGFLEDNFGRKIARSELRSVVPCSVRHASRLFRAELGISPFQYLRLYRLFKASIALQKGDAGVLSLALDCGYASLSSFYVDFKRYYGMSPRGFMRATARGE